MLSSAVSRSHNLILLPCHLMSSYKSEAHAHTHTNTGQLEPEAVQNAMSKEAGCSNKRS